MIHKIEKYLPLRPYDAEWKAVGEGKNKDLYLPFTHLETYVPWAFKANYTKKRSKIMRVSIECSFTLRASHKIQKVGFKGKNEVVIDTPLTINNLFGAKETNINIKREDEAKYSLQITSSSLLDLDDYVPFIEKFAEYLSYLINKEELNPHYGTSYVNIEWYDLHRTLLTEDS